MIVKAKKIFMWLTTLVCLAVPPTALAVRWRDAQTAESMVVRGTSALDVSLEQCPTPESLDWSHAMSDFQRARSLSPGTDIARRAEGLLHVARTYEALSHGEVVLAQTEATTATRLLPTEPRATLAAAIVMLRRGDAPRAERMFDAVEHTQGLSASVRVRSVVHHVDVLLDAGRGHDALVLVESLDESLVRSATVVNRIGLVRSAVGDTEGARAAFVRARSLDPHDPAPGVNLARLARSRGDLDDARTLLEQCVAQDANHGESWLAYGIVLSEMGPEHAVAARNAMVKAGQLRPDDPESFVAFGDMDLRDGHWAAAVENFRQALQHAPEHIGARTNLGVALARTGDRQGAIRAFQEVTERAPQTGAAWNGLGAMRLAMGDEEHAVGALQHAAVLLPNDPNPTVNLGIALSRLQRWTDAARAFRDTLDRSPGHPTAMMHLMAMQPNPAARARIARLASR
jgi:Flp pilus assembly protein TadD